MYILFMIMLGYFAKAIIIFRFNGYDNYIKVKGV